MELAKQNAEFEAFQTEYNMLKEEYMGLMVKDESGTAN